MAALVAEAEGVQFFEGGTVVGGTATPGDGGCRIVELPSGRRVVFGCGLSVWRPDRWEVAEYKGVAS